MNEREARPPTEEEAQATYRAAWENWCVGTDRDQRMALEMVMDSMQPFIADNPTDPRWKAFTSTLPGFDEFWSQALVLLKKELQSKGTKER